MQTLVNNAITTLCQQVAAGQCTPQAAAAMLAALGVQTPATPVQRNPAPLPAPVGHSFGMAGGNAWQQPAPQQPRHNARNPQQPRQGNTAGGVTMCSLLRWLGSKGYSEPVAASIMQRAGYNPSRYTVHCQITGWATHHAGNVPADHTARQMLGL